MRRLPRTLLALLALSLIGNGPIASFAGTSKSMSNAMHETAAQAGKDSAPCHGQTGSDSAPSVPEPIQHDCCEHGGCLCVLGTSTLAAVDAVTIRDFPPQHFSSVSVLTEGHPHGGPARLLRPPIG